MNEHVVIIYSENPAQPGGFDLGSLGESLSGFAVLLKSLSELARVNGDVEIRATRIREGSIEVYTTVHLLVDGLPFTSIQHLYDFLQLTDTARYREALEFFNSIGGVHKGINDYFASHTFDSGVFQVLFSYFLVEVFQRSRRQKTQPVTNQTPPRIAKKLRELVAGGSYSRAMRPLLENNVARIRVAALQVNKPIEVVVTEDNVGDFLPEAAQILPEFKNGATVTLTAEVLALQSARGDTLRVRVLDIPRQHSLLVAHPREGRTTEDYKQYYRQKVTIRAEIFRKTLYKKPELLIKSIAPYQTQLL